MFRRLFSTISDKLKQRTQLLIAKSVHISYEGVPHEPEPYKKNTSNIKIIKKFLHKYLILKLYGQTKLEIKKINESQRVLWIYTGKRNFGDAIMDLSGRALLKESNFNIDLFTLPNLHKLFAEDDIFKNVFSELREVKLEQYDVILMSEYNLPSIRLKVKNFKDTKFACLFQFFYGPDRNQTYFSYSAINEIFACGYLQSEIFSLSKPYLSSKLETIESARHLTPADRFLAISIGGIDLNRTYAHWQTVLELLDRESDPQIPKEIVLLGSDNGLAAAGVLKKLGFGNLNINSYVGELTLLQSRAIIAQASLFIGCDGGLMHVAHTTNTPSVSLFSHREPPYLRLTERCYSLGIQSALHVSDIPPGKIVSAITQQLREHADR